jgi:hypothetical protein
MAPEKFLIWIGAKQSTGVITWDATQLHDGQLAIALKLFSMNMSGKTGKGHNWSGLPTLGRLPLRPYGKYCESAEAAGRMAIGSLRPESAD